MPVTDQKTDRQDITHLKPQAIYEAPSRRRVWVSLVNESSKDFHQNNVAQACSSSPKLAQKSVITSRVFRADIIPRIRETQKKNNKRQYGSVEIRCMEDNVLWALQDQGNMPFWNQCQHLSLNEACCHAAAHTVLVVWQGVIINKGIEGDKSLSTIKDSSDVKKRSG